MRTEVLWPSFHIAPVLIRKFTDTKEAAQNTYPKKLIESLSSQDATRAGHWCRFAGGHAHPVPSLQDRSVRGRSQANRQGRTPATAFLMGNFQASAYGAGACVQPC